MWYGGGVEGGSAEERRRVMEGIITEELRREMEISEVRERKRTAGIVSPRWESRRTGWNYLKRAGRLGETGK